MLALDDDDLRDAVRRLAIDPAQSRRYRLENVVRRNFEALAAIASVRSPIQFAYSVKTNPDAAFLSAACTAGIYAEVIGPQELALAHEFGFGARTVYNGPWPAWRAGANAGVVFADSVEAFAENERRLEGSLLGARVRPPAVRSRFGVGRDDLHRLAEAIRASGRRTIAIGFHVRPEDYGAQTWRSVVEDVLDIATTIERTTHARVVAFDVGGGRTPLEFDRGLAAGDLAWLVRSCTQTLPAVQTIFLEPGQAVATPCAVVAAPVLERRAGEIVIAAGYPEVTQVRAFRHRVLGIFDDGSISLLGDGTQRILGRTCLEYDIIRDDVALPASLGSLIGVIIADAGAYDYSMAFDFALGGNNKRDDLGVTGR